MRAEWRRIDTLSSVNVSGISLGIGQLAVSAKAHVAEKIDETAAVTFANEMPHGGYKAVVSDALKKWKEEKKGMLIVNTVPLGTSPVGKAK